MSLIFNPAVNANPVRNFSVRVDSESYRYLRLRIRSISQASKSITVTINTGGPKSGGGGTTDLLSGIYTLRKHTIQTGAVNTFVVVDIDLCAPFNHKPTPDEQNSRWGNSGATPKNLEGPLWGANEIWTITLTLPTGTNYELDYIKLVRSELPRITASNPDFTLASADSGITGGRNTIVADTEGRRSLEVRATAGSGSLRTITQGVAEADARNGWDAVDVTNSSLWYAPQQYSDFGSARSDLVAYVGASGALWQGDRDGDDAAINVTQWLERQGTPDGSGYVTVGAQVMAEKIYAGPDLGNLLVDGTTGGPMVLPYAKVLRGQAVGLCYGGGAYVDVLGYGSGAVASDAQYRTGATYPPNHSPDTYRVKVRGSSLPTGVSSSRRIEHRTPRRFAFDSAVSSSRGNIWVCHTSSDKMLRGEVLDGDLTITRFRSATAASGVDITGPVTSYGDVNFAAFVMERSAANRILILLDRTVSGNREIWFGYSDDDGDTAGNFAKLTNGIRAMPAVSAANDQLSVYFKYNTGSSGPGKLYGRYRGRGDSSFGSEFALLDTAGANITVANETGFSNLAKAREAADRWVMSLLINGESAVSEWESSDTGTTWKRI
jgi:hypothetical protein